MADSLVDTLACVPSINRSSCMLIGPREVLHSLEQVLSTVGGPDSPFLARLRRTMAEVDLPSGSPSRISFVAEGDVDTEASVGQSDTNSPMLVSPDTVNISL